VNFLPGRKVAFDKSYSAFDFAFGQGTPCLANSRSKAERRSKVLKDRVPYRFFVFVGANDLFGFFVGFVSF
jgi:hypothetical protein